MAQLSLTADQQRFINELNPKYRHRFVCKHEALLKEIEEEEKKEREFRKSQMEMQLKEVNANPVKTQEI